jgi:hypothetical protein
LQNPGNKEATVKDLENMTIPSKSDFELERYSKATLIELLRLYSKLYIALDGFWYLAMKGEFGNEKALKHDIWVWEKMHKREFEGLIKVLGIQQRDLHTFFQVFLLTPWFHQTEYQVDFENEHYAVLTIHHCPTLLALEKEGEGREKEICHVVDVDYFDKFAKLFNPNLGASPLQLPPRQIKEGFCCKWAYTLKS